MRLARLAVACGLVFASTSQAGMGNIATNYGLLPIDVSSAQGLSLFNTRVSAIYYNPSQLSRDKRGELTGALLHGEHELKAVSMGGTNPPVRQGDVLMSAPTQHTLIGMKTDLTSLTKYERPLYFGLIAGIEKFGTEMMAFSSQTANEGQYMRYGRNPLFLNMGGAMQVIPGIDVGASARITLHSEASLIAQADLAGNTEYEKMDVSAQPSIRPIVGASFDFGTLFCQQDCMFSGIEAALVYRAFSNTATTVTANTVIPGTIPDPGLTLAITTLDSWQPDVLAVGLQYKRDDWRVALTLERQNWSDLGREFRGDTIKDQAAMSFSDITIPRLGAEMRFNEIFFLTAGVALEKSPLKGRDSLNVNYFDNDKVVVGLGLGLELANPPVLAFPVRLDLGYQYQQLKAREFDLTAANAPSNPYETVEAEGDIHILSGSITLKF